MPPKRGRDDRSPAKAPIQTHTKRTRRDYSPPSPSLSVATPTANVGPSTGHNDPSHSPSADDDPSLIVDYNESTPLPSPHSGDEHSALMGHKSPIDEASKLEEASMLPDNEEHASSPAPTSAATVTERAAPKGAVASQQEVSDNESSASLGVSPMSDVQTVHNGEPDSDESKPMTSTTTLNRVQSVLLARRREGGYVTGGMPPMPPLLLVRLELAKEVQLVFLLIGGHQPRYVDA